VQNAQLPNCFDFSKLQLASGILNSTDTKESQCHNGTIVLVALRDQEGVKRYGWRVFLTIVPAVYGCKYSECRQLLKPNLYGIMQKTVNEA
jgi:hypothetical protein